MGSCTFQLISNFNFKLTSIFFKVLLFQIITSVIIWTGFKRAAYQFKMGTGQNHLWKEIFISTGKKPIIFGKLYISNEEDFCHQLYFSLNFELNPNSGLCHCFKSSVIALWNFWLFIIWHFSLFTLMMELQFREVVSL